MNSFDPTFSTPLKSKNSWIYDIRRKIKSWIDSEPIEELVESFGGRVKGSGSLNESLVQLEQFSECWDYRRMARERLIPTDDNNENGSGSARWLTDSIELPGDLRRQILAIATQLGLVHATIPNLSEYDHVAVLGGARLSCKLRPERAADLIRSGAIKTANVALLGAARPVVDSERDATDTYAPNAVDEFDLMVAGGQAAFGFEENKFSEVRHEDPSNQNSDFIVRRYEVVFNSVLLNVSAFCAPSSQPATRRANSADTLEFLFAQEGISSGSSVLLVTSQIYVPYVQLEAVRTVGIPNGVYIETIGFSGEQMPTLQGLTNPQHYLQEVRSTIQAARRFCETYPSSS